MKGLSFFSNNRGMTLMEIMVVITIIAMMMGAAATRLASPNRHLKSTVRQIGILSKELHTKSRLLGKTFRIVFQMTEGKTHTYWVESSGDKVRLQSAEKREEIARLTTQAQERLQQNKPGFSLDASVTKEPLELPSPLIFEEIEYVGQEESLSEGRAYVYFFPEGLVQEVAIHISNQDKLNWTIATHPVTGRADIFTRKISLKDLRNQ